MNWAFLAVLLPLSSPDDGTGTTVIDERTRLIRDLKAWEQGTPLVGLTEKELLRKLGEPTSKEDGVWYYNGRLRLRAGLMELRTVHFARGRVVSAPLTLVPIGCIEVRER
jgi:hypothetical protein